MAATAPASTPSLYKEKIKELKCRRIEVNALLNEVNKKISELEDVYLMETTNGNIIRGWDLDSKLPRARNGDDKDSAFKLFSCSSYNVWLENKMAQENDVLKPVNTKADPSIPAKNSFLKTKRVRKSFGTASRKDGKDDFDWMDEYDGGYD